MPFLIIQRALEVPFFIKLPCPFFVPGVNSIQAANIARFGNMVYNVLSKWPFISVMHSHFENKII